MFKARAEGLKSITSKDVGDKIDTLTNNRERSSAISSSANEQKKIFAELQKDLIKTVIDKKLPDNLRGDISKAGSIKELEPIAKNIAEAEKQAAIEKLDAAFADNKIKLDTANAARDITIDAANQFKNIVAGSKSLIDTYNSSDKSKNSPSLGEAVNVGGMYPNGALDSLELQYKNQRSQLENSPSSLSNEYTNKVKDAQDAFISASNDLSARLAELDPAYKDAKKALEDNFTKSLLTFENNLSKREMNNLSLQTKKEIGSARLDSKMNNPETYTGIYTQEGYLAKQHELEMQKLKQEQDFQSKIDANTAAIELERKLYTLDNITAVKDNSKVIKDLIDQLQQSQPDALKSEGTISRDSANLSPATISQMAKLVSAEVGGQGPKAQQALIETFYNRAKRDNKSIDEIVNSKAYYEPIQTGRINSVTPIPDPEIRRLIGLVEAGSNESRGATDNASAGVAANAKKLYPNNNIDIGGETFYSKNIGSSNFADVGGMSSEIQKAVADIQKMNVEYSKIPDMAMIAAGNMGLQGDAQKNVATAIAQTVQQSALRNKKDEEAIKLAEELYKIKLEENKAKSFDSGFTQGMRNLNLETTRFSYDIGEKIPQMFSDNMANAMEEVIMKGGKVQDVLLGAASSFLSEINKAMFKNMANSFTTTLFGNYAAGGMITGGSGVKDDVPSMLMGGEFVMNKKAVSKYGSTFMTKLNNGTLSHFADGGYVGQPSNTPSGFQATGKDLESRLDLAIKNGETSFMGIPLGTPQKIGAGNTYYDKAANQLMQRSLDNKTTNKIQIGDVMTQSGQGGFYSPALTGLGISGRENLMSYATQNSTSGASDQFINEKNKFGGVAGINLEAESANLTQWGRTRSSPLNDDIRADKLAALGVVFQDMEREKQIKEQAEAEAAAEEQRRRDEKTARRKQWQGALAGLAISVGASAIGGAVVNGAKAGWSQAATNGSGLGGKTWGALGGAFQGGNLNGVQVGGLSNLFSGNFALSQIGNAKQLDNYMAELDFGKAKLDVNGIPKARAVSGSLQNYRAPSTISSNSITNSLTNSYAKNKFATGGSVPQRSGIDTVPAMLSGGEFVMNASAAQRIGPAQLNSMNSGSISAPSQDLGSNDKILAKLDELINVSRNSAVSVNVGANEASQTSSQQSQQASPSQSNTETILNRKIKAAVIKILQDEKRLGGSLRR